MNGLPVEAMPLSPLDSSPTVELAAPALQPVDRPKAPKAAIRESLRASTLDGVFATIFSNAAGGVLLSNFLVELDATAIEVGMLASIPMVANLLQPLGAYFSERTTSRHAYCLWIYAPARLLWLFLVLGIAVTSWTHADPHGLVYWTLGILFLTHFLGALGSASWLSWLAVLVPRRLRGRYFGVRNSAASLTNLLSVPLLGFVLSLWSDSPIEAYGLVLLIGVVAGIVSLGFQYFMVDVNPQQQHAIVAASAGAEVPPDPGTETAQGWHHLLKDANFLTFLLYFSLWMFAVNLSAPFFNLYLLDNLNLDIRWVTLYNSISAGANLLMLVLWGKIADRVGNRPLLLGVGILVAVTPLLWLGANTSAVSLWVGLPLLHLLAGGTWAAIDLCSNNMQLGVASPRYQAQYFSIAAAIAGVSGALGTTVGGFLTQFTSYGGILGLFAFSSVLRLVALLPLVFVHEQPRQSLRGIIAMRRSAAREASSQLEVVADGGDR